MSELSASFVGHVKFTSQKARFKDLRWLASQADIRGPSTYLEEECRFLCNTNKLHCIAVLAQCPMMKAMSESPASFFGYAFKSVESRSPLYQSLLAHKAPDRKTSLSLSLSPTI